MVYNLLFSVQFFIFIRLRWQQGPLTEIFTDVKPDRLKLLDKGIKGIILILKEDAYKKIDDSHNVIKLIKQSTNLQIKTIIDLDPTTSEVWFADSENVGNYSEYYIWKKPNVRDGFRQPPNNWVCVSLKKYILYFFTAYIYIIVFNNFTILRIQKNIFISRYVETIIRRGRTQITENNITILH